MMRLTPSGHSRGSRGETSGCLAAAPSFVRFSTRGWSIRWKSPSYPCCWETESPCCLLVPRPDSSSSIRSRFRPAASSCCRIACPDVGLAPASGTSTGVRLRSGPRVNAPNLESPSREPSEPQRHGRRRRVHDSLPDTYRALLPRRVDRLAYQVSGVCAGPRAEFLEPPRVDLCNIEIALLVGAHAVHTPQRAGEIGHGSPRVQQMDIEVVFQYLVRI